MADPQNIVILTGAGISAESGIPAFRTHGEVSYWEYTDTDGAPKKHRLEED